jgi:hypothetical protein
MTTQMRQVSSPVSVRPFVTITDPVVQNGYEEALLPYFSAYRIRTDLDLIDAIRGMLTEIDAPDRASFETQYRFHSWYPQFGKVSDADCTALQSRTGPQ